MASDPSGRRRTPARVLCLEPGAARWVDVPPYALAHLQHAIARGFPLARALLPDGRWHIFDFDVLLRFDEADPNAPRALLAWVEEGGNHFFPAGVRPEDVVIEPAGPCGVTKEEAVAIVRSWTFDGAVLTRVRRHVPTESMLRTFAEREESLGNVKLGWYGGSAADVEMAAASSLFRTNNWMLLGEDRAHGRGMHLSPLRFPHLSMNIAEADDKGEAHVLLCRIVHGVPDVVNAGSNEVGHRMEQERFVGGIDDLSNPSWYVVWSQHVERSIMPLCIVSFTKVPMIQDLGTPIQMIVNMQKLHEEFKRFLPPSKLQTLDYYFNNNMGNSNNFSRAVCELVGAAMFVGAVLRSLEH